MALECNSIDFRQFILRPHAMGKLRFCAQRLRNILWVKMGGEENEGDLEDEPLGEPRLHRPEFEDRVHVKLCWAHGREVPGRRGKQGVTCRGPLRALKRGTGKTFMRKCQQTGAGGLLTFPFRHG